MSNQYFGDDRIVHEPLNVPKAPSHRIYSDSEASDEIVTMLRREYDYFNNDGVGDYELLTIAADEIEGLRAEISRLMQIICDASPDDDYLLVRRECDVI